MIGFSRQLLALSLLALSPTAGLAQASGPTEVATFKASRPTGLPAELRVRTDLDATTWPTPSVVHLLAGDVELGTLKTEAEATFERPQPGHHAFVEVFQGSSRAGVGAASYSVAFSLQGTDGLPLTSGTAVVTPDQPEPPVLSLLYGPSHKEVKAKVKIEVVATAKRVRYVASVTDLAHGLVQDVALEVTPLGEDGKPGTPTKLALAQTRSVLRVEAAAAEADALIDAAGTWQADLPATWAVDVSGDGTLVPMGDAMLAIDARDLVLTRGTVTADGSGPAAFDLVLKAARIEDLAGGLRVEADDGSDATGPATLGWRVLKPEFVLNAPFSADPAGTTLEVKAQLYNGDGKATGLAESCKLVVGDPGPCKTPSGLAIRTGAWSGQVLDLVVTGPGVPAFDPASWPRKAEVGVAVLATDLVKVTGPTSQAGTRAVAASDPSPLPNVLAYEGGPDAAGIGFLVHALDGKGTPTAQAALGPYRINGEILIDGVKFEVE